MDSAWGTYPRRSAECGDRRSSRLSCFHEAGPRMDPRGKRSPMSPVRRHLAIVDGDANDRRTLESHAASLGLSTMSFCSAEEALAAAGPVLAGCLAVDLRLPGISGIDLLLALREKGVLFTAFVSARDASISQAVAAMRAGAIDLLTKPVELTAFRRAVERALQLDARRQAKRANRSTTTLLYSKLSRRERDVLNLLTAGRHNADIAFDLGISVKTVEAHRSNLKRKIGATSTAELVRFAYTLREPLT